MNPALPRLTVGAFIVFAQNQSLPSLSLSCGPGIDKRGVAQPRGAKEGARGEEGTPGTTCTSTLGGTKSPQLRPPSWESFPESWTANFWIAREKIKSLLPPSMQQPSQSQEGLQVRS